MGGVIEQPRTLIPLTADICARAIVAAARSYGADPLKACVAKRGPIKRAMTAAADGLMEATWQPASVISRTLGINSESVAAAVRKNGEAFRAASRAASRAARYAGWRPETRVSVASSPLKPAAVTKPAEVRNRFTPPEETRVRRPATKASAPHVPTPPKGPVQVSEEDAQHLTHIRQANGGKGFPAPAAA